jgi:hypothetical protein
MASEIKLKVNAEVDPDAKWLLNRQERMEKQRLEFIGDLFRYTASLVLTYDKDEAETDGEREVQDESVF